MATAEQRKLSQEKQDLIDEAWDDFLNRLAEMELSESEAQIVLNVLSARIKNAEPEILLNF